MFVWSDVNEPTAPFVLANVARQSPMLRQTKREHVDIGVTILTERMLVTAEPTFLTSDIFPMTEPTCPSEPSSRSNRMADAPRASTLSFSSNDGRARIPDARASAKEGCISHAVDPNRGAPQCTLVHAALELDV